MHGGMTKIVIMFHRKENLICSRVFKIIVAEYVLKEDHIQIIKSP